MLRSRWASEPRWAAGYFFGVRLAVVFLAFADRVAVFFAVAVLVAPHDPLHPAFMVVFFALGERFALVFVAVVFLVAFGFAAMFHGSSIVDALF